MNRISDREGELLIDHRDSPGIPESMALEAGLPAEAAHGLYKAPVYTCGHCQAGVLVIVGAFGTREKRYLCSGCRTALCERCGRQKALTGICRPFEQWVHEHLEALEKSLILLP